MGDLRPLPAPRFCPDCKRIAHRARQARLALVARSVDVQTWCRTCGKPALMNILLDYARAVHQFQMMNFHAMTHQVGNHVETGGWGWRWRLDEVLSKVFPHAYADDPRRPFWPVPNDANRLSEDRAPRIIHNVGNACMSPDARESNRCRLEEAINADPKTRAELEASAGPVWNHEEVEHEFDLCGFIPPFVFVIRKSDGMVGTLVFQRQPKLYWGFDPGRVV
jgi:hypothetical protein